MIDRRHFLVGGAAAAGLSLLPSLSHAAQAADFVMWHSPGCGCCLQWLPRIEAAFRRKVQVIETPDMGAVKRRHGVPEDLQSCHTALIGGVVVEGHVPPADLRRAISMRGRRFQGLAVPGMPMGSPGMDVGHNQREAYQVIAFGRTGRSVFARHG